MLTIEEMEGTPQKGPGLAGTIDAIISVVRSSKGQPSQSAEEKAITASELATLFKADLAPKANEDVSEAQERIDLDALRRALYASD